MAHSSYTTRKAAFKQIDSAIRNLDIAMTHLHGVKEVYKDAHPKIADYIEGLNQYLLIGQQYIEYLRKSF